MILVFICLVHMSAYNWPSNTLGFNEEEINKETRKTNCKVELQSTILFLASAKINSEKDKSWYSENFSKYTSRIRVLA